MGGFEITLYSQTNITKINKDYTVRNTVIRDVPKTIERACIEAKDSLSNKIYARYIDCRNVTSIPSSSYIPYSSIPVILYMFIHMLI